jgi:hypothetical protein
MVMKMRMVPLLLAFSPLVLFLPGCKTTPPVEPASSMEDATSIQIECRNEKTLQTSILQQLRSIKAKDIIVNSFGEELDISAAFRVVDTPPYKAYAFGDDLEKLRGIFFVKVEKRHTVVRQP